jgi:hypothetical protein
MQALVAVVALVVLPAAVAYVASRPQFFRSRPALRVIVRLGVLLIVAAADLIICVNVGLIQE